MLTAIDIPVIDDPLRDCMSHTAQQIVHLKVRRLMYKHNTVGTWRSHWTDYYAYIRKAYEEEQYPRIVILSVKLRQTVQTPQNILWL